MNRPEGFHTITPYLILKNASEAIELYKTALGAEEISILNCPKSGKVVHAELRIGDSPLFVADENPSMGNVVSMGQHFYLYVDNVDDLHKKALEQGLSEKNPVEESIWGDRVGRLADPFGNIWSLATREREVSLDEMREALQELSSRAA